MICFVLCVIIILLIIGAFGVMFIGMFLEAIGFLQYGNVAEDPNDPPF